jgi:hypothetical protein
VQTFQATLASTTATIVAGRETHLEIAMGGADLTLTVVDGDGRPAAGATVRLSGTGPIQERREAPTNEKGRYRFRSLGKGLYLLRVTHPTLGLLSDVEIVIDSDEPVEREVVLDGDAALDLLLVDGDVALPGLTCRLVDRSGADLTAAVLSGEDGRARIPRLTPGVYRLRVAGDSVWDLEVELDVQRGAGLRALELRRLGDLEIRVVTADGAAVAGARVELTDELTGESVADWIAAGRAAGPGGAAGGAPGALKADVRGVIALSGLPHGTYAWKLGAAAGVLAVRAGKGSLALLGES